MPLALYFVNRWLRFSVMCEGVVTCLGKIHDRRIFRAANAGTLRTESRTACSFAKGLNKHTISSQVASQSVLATALPCDWDVTYSDFQGKGKK